MAEATSEKRLGTVTIALQIRQKNRVEHLRTVLELLAGWAGCKLKYRMFAAKTEMDPQKAPR